MTGKTHITVGVATALMASSAAGFNDIPMILMAGAIGGIIPDIDTKKSQTIIDNLLPKSAAFVIAIILIVADFYTGYGFLRSLWANPFSQRAGIFVILIYLVRGFYAPHRGFTHSILGCLISGFAIKILYSGMITAYIAGYISHILIDTLNTKEVKIFYPMKKGICFKLCKANGKMNDLLSFLAGIMIAYSLIMYYRP